MSGDDALGGDDGAGPPREAAAHSPAPRRRAASRGLGLTRAQTQAQFRQRQKVRLPPRGGLVLKPCPHKHSVAVKRNCCCLGSLLVPSTRHGRVGGSTLDQQGSLCALPLVLRLQYARNAWLPRTTGEAGCAGASGSRPHAEARPAQAGATAHAGELGCGQAFPAQVTGGLRRCVGPMSVTAFLPGSWVNEFLLKPVVSSGPRVWNQARRQVHIDTSAPAYLLNMLTLLPRDLEMILRPATGGA